MPKAKIAVTLPPDLVTRMRRAVRQGRAENISAYVSRAIEERTTRDDLAEMLEQMLAETGGPLTAREQRTADDALGIRRRRRIA